MSTDMATMEKRLAALETAVAELQRKLATTATAPNWIEQISGIVKDKEAFEEAMRYGREYRQSNFPPDEPEDAVP